MDANLFVQALMLSPSAWQGCCALLISMGPGRQRGSLHSLSYLCTPPLCILRVSPRYHPSAGHRCMPAHIHSFDLLPLRTLTGRVTMKTEDKNTSEDMARVCWFTRKSRDEPATFPMITQTVLTNEEEQRCTVTAERQREGPVRLCTAHK